MITAGRSCAVTAKNIATRLHHRTLDDLRKILLLISLMLPVAGLLGGCDAAPQKSDAELGLNPVQATGRHIFERQCELCHSAYTSHARKGPSLQGLFKKPYMQNGMPANDDRVRDIIVYGRSKMPAFGRVLNPQQIDEVLQYLHTL